MVGMWYKKWALERQVQKVIHAWLHRLHAATCNRKRLWKLTHWSQQLIVISTKLMGNNWIINYPSRGIRFGCTWPNCLFFWVTLNDQKMTWNQRVQLSMESLCVEHEPENISSWMLSIRLTNCEKIQRKYIIIPIGLIGSTIKIEPILTQPWTCNILYI